MLTTSHTVLLLALAGLAGTITQSRALVLVAICGIPLVLVLHTVRRHCHVGCKQNAAR
jgi:hypothetical protein